MASKSSALRCSLDENYPNSKFNGPIRKVEIFQIKTMILKRHNPTFLHGGASEIQGIDSSHHFEKLQGRSSNSEPRTSKQFFRSF